MQFNGVYNLEHKSYPCDQWFLIHAMCQDSSCSWSVGRRSGFVGILVCVFWVLAFFLSIGTPWRLSPLPCPFLSFHCFISVTGACFFFSPSTWGLMAGFPGFVSHGSGLHLGAGCHLSGSSGMSQEPNLHGKAVVNSSLIDELVNWCVKGW